MDSYLETQLGQSPRRRGGGLARAAGSGSSQPVGYRLSSDDLSTGLEVRTININSLPVELVAELVRMRRLWEGAEVPVQPIKG